MTRAFDLVDVFSDTPWLGNGLAVVHDAAGLEAEEMQRITQWLNLSETTFLLPPTTPQADYRVRIFTLNRELPFAGHPTLGTCHAWLEAGGVARDPARIVQECGAGLIAVRRVGGRLAFAAPPLVREGPASPDEAQAAADLLRIDPARIVEARWVDNGPGWLGVLLGSAEEVLALEPARASEQRMDIGVVGPHPAGGEVAFEVRALFSDHTGAVREDPVTGSLNASLAQWLYASGRAHGPFVASQGVALGRAGRIHLDIDPDGQVWVGGGARTLFSGRMTGG